jgi:uncharacterized membrane protein
MSTLKGGVLFLIPVTVVLVILEKAIHFMTRVIEPVVAKLPYTHFAGVSILTLLNIVLLLLICFLAGLCMRTPFAKKMKVALEEKFLVYVPGYTYIQALSENKLKGDDNVSWRPATILVDDNEVVCFVVDESENYCSIFLPDAPTPSSGSICIRDKKMVTYLSINMGEANVLIRKFGKGAAATFEKTKDISTEEGR